MTRSEIYNLLYRMLDNYMGALDSASVWGSTEEAMTIDRATDILDEEINGGEDEA